MNLYPTVRVETSEHYPALLMTWEREVKEGDVVRAFNRITTLLNMTDHPQYVIVDVRDKPVFPLRATINSALFGPYRHPKLTAWLVVGSNPLGCVIEKTLVSVTKRRNVEWFETLDAVTEYLQEHTYQRA